MKTHFISLMAVAILGACAAEPSAPTEADTSTAERLRAAHDAYLDHDLETLTSELGVVLADIDAPDSVRGNATELLERAWAEGEGALPTVDRALPDGVDDLMIDVVRRSDPETLAFRIVVRGESDGALRDIQVESAEGELLAARLAEVGTWTEDGSEFELESPEISSLPESVFFVRLVGPDWERRYWVPVEALACLATPTVHDPVPNGTVGPRPTLSWEDFHSPSHQAFERRTLGVWLGRRVPGEGVEFAMGRFFSEDPPTELTFDEDLLGGEYWLAVTFGEVRRLGPLRLRRLCRSSLPFEVELP